MEGVSRLRSLRIAKGLSQSTLAERIGVTQGQLSRWEACAFGPRFQFIPRLSTELDVPPDELARLIEEDMEAAKRRRKRQKKTSA